MYTRVRFHFYRNDNPLRFTCAHVLVRSPVTFKELFEIALHDAIYRFSLGALNGPSR